MTAVSKNVSTVAKAMYDASTEPLGTLVLLPRKVDISPDAVETYLLH